MCASDLNLPSSGLLREANVREGIRDTGVVEEGVTVKDRKSVVERKCGELGTSFNIKKNKSDKY